MTLEDKLLIWIVGDNVSFDDRVRNTLRKRITEKYLASSYMHEGEFRRAIIRQQYPKMIVSSERILGGENQSKSFPEIVGLSRVRKIIYVNPLIFGQYVEMFAERKIQIAYEKYLVGE